VSEAAVTQAIALSGVAVENNRRAFACGRVLAARAQAGARTALALAPPEHWQSLTMRRAAELFQYQNAAYAAQYREAVS
jgi:indolepyruvate ferredoxin oxidoreductase